MRLINTVPVKPSVSGVVVELSIDELKTLRLAMGHTSHAHINSYVKGNNLKPSELSLDDHSKLFITLDKLVREHG